MPPDDNLFPSEGDPNRPDQLPEGTTPDSADSGINKEELAGLIQQFVEPNTAQMQRITDTQAALSESIQAIAARIGMGEGQQAPAGEVDVSEFLADPASHINEIAKAQAAEAVRESVAPLLGQIVQQTYNTTVQTQERAIDAEFGQGTWKTHFWPELEPIFDRTQKEAPSQLGNTEAIQRAVDTVKGAKFSILADARVGAVKSQEEAKQAELESLQEIVRSNMTGGIGRGAGKAPLSQEMKDYIETELRATGEKPDEAQFLASYNSGSTLKDWQAAQKGLKKE